VTAHVYRLAPAALRWLFIAVMLCAVPGAQAQDWNYRVRPGDTLWDLGALYLKPDVAWQQLQAHNRVADPYRLPPGLRLRFPIAWLRVTPAPARVVAVRGRVQVQDSDNGSRAVIQDMLLPIGSTLQTGAEASVTLAFADDSRLQLRENSQLQLDQLSSYGATGMVDTRLRLQRGRSSSRVTPARGPASRYIITAPTATSSVRGTVFRVSAGAAGAIAATEVMEGRVQVDTRSTRQLVGAGQASLDPSSGTAAPALQALLPAPELLDAQLRLQPLPLSAAWQAVAGAARYRVEVVQSAAPEVLLFARETNETTLGIDQLPAGQLRLLVRAVAADGSEGLDAERDFTVPEGLPAPLTVAPRHGQTVQQAQPRFEWAKVDGAVASVLQVATDPAFLHPLVEQRTSGQRWRTTDALPEGRYYWRVASLDAQGQQGRYGQSMPLQRSDVPVDPSLQQLQPGKRMLTLRWQASDGHPRYRVQIARNAAFSKLLLDREVDAPEVTLKQPWRGGTLHVRVQQIDDDGYAGAFSATQQVKLRCGLCYGAGAGALLLLAL